MEAKKVMEIPIDNIVPSGVEPPSPGPKPRRITTTLRDYVNIFRTHNI